MRNATVCDGASSIAIPEVMMIQFGLFVKKIAGMFNCQSKKDYSPDSDNSLVERQVIGEVSYLLCTRKRVRLVVLFQHFLRNKHSFRYFNVFNLP